MKIIQPFAHQIVRNLQFVSVFVAVIVSSCEDSSPVLSDLLGAQVASTEHPSNRNLYAVVRANASRELMDIIRQSLLTEGYVAEFSDTVYNQQKLLTSIRMKVKQGNQVIGDVAVKDQLLDKPIIFFALKNKNAGLSQGYPKSIPSGDMKRLEILHGFMATDGKNVEIRGNMTVDN